MGDTELLNKAIDSAKKFENFQDVLMAVSLHPEWLTLIPDERKWAILHQIIFSGHVNNLDQLLALQKANRDFRLLTNTRDQETVLDIASLRKDIPKMREHIQLLIKIDEMLNYARCCKWDECYNIAKENPTFVNEKPPYRRFYLIHHMACANAIDQFQRFQQIKGCMFDPTLRADRKKINVIAREANHPEFAAFMEKQFPNLLDQDDSTFQEIYRPSDEAVKQTKNVTLMVQKAVVQDLEDNLMGEQVESKSRGEVVKQLSVTRSERTRKPNQTSAATSKVDDDKQKSLVLDNLTCPLTMNVFVDPVIAADGFTYERSAIKKWLEKNDCSPMTNQKLSTKDLSPNNVIKLIINALKS
jgi:hypothetical protein